MGRIRRAGWAFCLATVLAGSTAALSGCATPAGAEGSLGDGELINQVAAQIAGSDSITYTEVFGLDNDATVSIAHSNDPDRTAYHFPGGMVLVTPTETTSCRIAKATTCRHLAAVSPTTGLPAEAEMALEAAGMVRPETVVTMLSDLALNTDALISEQDMTIAGQNATCIAVSGVPEPQTFTACVTSDGLLGSFSGTAGSALIDVQLNSYQLTVRSTDFELPAGAKMTS